MDHYGQLPPLCSSIIDYRVSKPQPSANSNHKFTTFTIPTSQYPSVSAPPHLFNAVSSSAKSELKLLTVNALHQPHAPTKPGEFGVLFTGSECVRKGNGKDGEVLYDLVVREGNKAWRYYGVYKAIRLQNLGRGEWHAVDKDVSWLSESSPFFDVDASTASGTLLTCAYLRPPASGSTELGALLWDEWYGVTLGQAG